MRTSVYIDGFNLYYLAVRGTRYKWLDLRAVCQKLLPLACKIGTIKYFTAHVSGKFDPDQPIRQSTYIRALESHIPELEVYYGHFTTHPKGAPLVIPEPAQTHAEVLVPQPDGSTQAMSLPLVAPKPHRKFARIFKTEEKGSDVNIAVHLLNDAWEDKFDCGVIISNDSDLAEALKLVKAHAKKKTLGLIYPGLKGNPSRELQKHANFVKQIRKGVLSSSQLPDPVPGKNPGESYSKPAGW